MKTHKNIQVESLKTLLKENKLLEKHHLEKMGLFGSFVRGDEANDIDILVDSSTNYKHLIAFKAELEKLAQKKVDIVIEKFANPIVLYRAKKEIVYVTRY